MHFSILYLFAATFTSALKPPVLTQPDSDISMQDTSSSAPVALYSIQTKSGTSLDTFHDFIDGLDGGSGVSQENPEAGVHVYYTEITSAQVTQVEPLNFVDYVLMPPPLDQDVPPLEELNQRPSGEALQRRAMTERALSGDHLKLLSSNVKSPMVPKRDYLADDTLGEGQTIYVIDTGFDLNANDFQMIYRAREVTTAVVPNAIAAPSYFSAIVERPFVEGIVTDYGNHGTGVAAAAGGFKNGVASNAHLHLIKNCARIVRRMPTEADPNNEIVDPCLTTFSALRWSLKEVIRHIDQDRDRRVGNAVVTFARWYPTAGMSQSLFAAHKKIWTEFLQDTKDRGVVVVLPAGTRNPSDPVSLLNMANYIPQKFATPETGVIIVGAVNNDGTIAPYTSYADPAEGVEISVWAQGTDVRLPIPQNMNAGGESSQEMQKTGTSLAAPIVAGLVAYIRGCPTFQGDFDNTTNIKNFIEYHSFERVPSYLELVSHGVQLSYPVPPQLNVAYNLARGPRPKLPNEHDCEPAPGIGPRSLNVITVCTPSDNSTNSSSNATSPMGTPWTRTDSSTVPPGTSTAPTSISVTSPLPAPTQSVDLGTLTCGTRTDPGNPEHWMALKIEGGEVPAGAYSAVNYYCAWLASTDAYFSPDEDNLDKPYHYNGYSTDPIFLNAQWTQDPGCPALDFRDDSEEASQYCHERFGDILTNCDNDEDEFFYGKQGGSFFRDCITWTIQRDRWDDAPEDDSYRPPPTCTNVDFCSDKCGDQTLDADLSCVEHMAPGYCVCIGDDDDV